MANIQALGEYICVEVIKEEEKTTESGIVIAEEARKRDGDVVFCKKGKVVSYGEGVDLEVSKGDIILYNPYDVGVFEDHGLINYKLIKAVLKPE